MQPINLQAIPNQELQFVADGQQYDITLRANGKDIVLMDVSMNGAVVINGCPCIVGQMVIPYAYLEGAGGNFIFTTASGNNPQWANFGAADVLLYVSAADMASARATNAANATSLNLGTGQAL